MKILSKWRHFREQWWSYPGEFLTRIHESTVNDISKMKKKRKLCMGYILYTIQNTSHWRKCDPYEVSYYDIESLGGMEMLLSSTRVNINNVPRSSDAEWQIIQTSNYTIPNSKVHGANMGPTWVLSAPDGSHVGPTNPAIKDMFPREITAYHIVNYPVIYRDSLDSLHSRPKRTPMLLPKFENDPLLADPGREKHPFFNLNRRSWSPVKHNFWEQNALF